MFNLTKKLIILDRDGVINYDSLNYVRSPDEWLPIPGSLDAIARLNEAGFRIAVATNQSGVGRGYYTVETLNAMHQKMQDLLAEKNGHIDAIFYCPHLPSELCECRKPKPGLLKKIGQHFNCTLDGIPFIGDSFTDIEAGLAVNASPIFLADKPAPNCHYHFKNLSDAVDVLLEKYHLGENA
jgi:D-glycero-D-manno-heptose 1,7-bisphosphate phosphatase